MLLLLLLRKTITACQYLENSTGGPENCFSHQHTSEESRFNLPQEAFGPMRSNCFSRRVFLRKHIATCDFPVLEGGGSETPAPTHL